MKTVCLYFEIHQNIHLKRYRFFDIGRDHYYYDDYENERSITETAEKSYVPALTTLLEMVKRYDGYFKFAISLSGSAIDQLEDYAPQVIDLLHQLNDTKCVEILAEPYSHGLSSLASPAAFKEEVKHLCKRLKQLFNVKPTIFRNSALFYNDEIGQMVADMGFKGMLTEGAKHILGWKSPHYVYNCNLNPDLKLLLRDSRLSEDISLRFSDTSWSEYPLFADTYADWIAEQPEEEQVINIFMELCALGIFQPLHSNILDFLVALPEKLLQRNITFSTPSEICKTMPSAGDYNVPDPISWVGNECDISSWLGNDMQREAFNKLYSVSDRVLMSRDKGLKLDWSYLQASNNLRFISTKPESKNMYRGIYDSAYDAFTNYMNILGDFITRVNNEYPEDYDNEQLNALLTTIKNQDEELQIKDKEIDKLRSMISTQLNEKEKEETPSPSDAPKKCTKKVKTEKKQKTKKESKK